APAPGTVGGATGGGGVRPGTTGGGVRPGTTGGGVAPGATGGGGDAAGSRRGATAVFGSALPPCISAVGASAPTTGSGVSSSSAPDSGGANTVAGSGTPSTPPELAFASAHGLPADDEAGTPSVAVGSYSASDSADDTEDPEAEEEEEEGEKEEEEEDDAGTSDSGVAAAGVSDPMDDTARPSDAPDSADDTEAEDTEAPDPAPTPEPTGESPSPPAPESASSSSSCEAFGRCGRPILSAASCNHSGGLSKNDVWFRSIRAGGAAGAGTTASSATPYSSSYRRITSPTGSPGHNVASPESRAITSRCRPVSAVGPPSRSSAHTTKPRPNSRTRTSWC
ncbi:hypothetical protein ACWGBV_24920, partial [Streptomyces sp. NPDC055051]